MAFVSGEIYYQAKLSKCLDLCLEENLKSLHTFLGSDVDSRIQKSQSRTALDRLKSIRRLNSTVYDKALAHDSITLQHYFDATCRSALHEATYHGGRMTAEVAQLQESADTKLMQCILQYFSILKDEMNSTRERLDEHSVNCCRKRHQAKRLRDIQIFSRHLEIETQGAVSCDLIPCGTSQWTRCGKAIKDNLSISRLQSNGFCDVKVLNAFKVHHKFLSDKIQYLQKILSYHSSSPQCIKNFNYDIVFPRGKQEMNLRKKRAAGQIPAAGKVKGLFCSLSKNYIYGFSAYGLYTQATNTKNDVNDGEFISSSLPDIFQLPWFSSELSGKIEAVRATDKVNKDINKDNIKNNNKDNIEDNINDSKNKKSYNNNKNNFSDTIEYKNKPKGTAETLAKANCSQCLRFSKYSNPNKISKLNLNWKDDHTTQLKENNEGGNILVLCRVLIKKILTVENDIDEVQIQNAKDGGYDSIYSRSREEYVLINPEFVLPEFFMHVQYSNSDGNLNHYDMNQNPSKSQFISLPFKASSSKISIPSALTVSTNVNDSSYVFETGSMIMKSAKNEFSSPLFPDEDNIGTLLMKNRIMNDDNYYENNYYKNMGQTDLKKRNGLLEENNENSHKKHGKSSFSDKKQKSTDPVSNNSMMRNKQMIVYDIENSTNCFNFERIKILNLLCENLRKYEKNYSLQSDEV